MFDQEVFSTIIHSFQGGSDERVEFKYYDLGKYKEVFAAKMVDVIIGIGAAFQHDEKNIYRKIWDLDVCAGVSLNHSLANTDSVDVHELENEPIVAIDPEAGEELYSDFISLFYRDGLSPKIVKTLNTLMDLKLSVALGEGVGISQVKSALHRMLCISSISKTRIIMQNLA